MKKKDTKGADYTQRLERLSGRWWKEALDVQRPYRWNLRRLQLGKVLDVGCGIGRHLQHFKKGSVGTDHNKHSIEKARELGLEAYTPDEFFSKKFKKGQFDSLLLAHVLEHMTIKQGKDLLKQYLPYVKSRVVVICPQERGFASDATHVKYLDSKSIEKILKEVGLKIDKSYSFPFPRPAGMVFRHNEFIVVGRK